MIFLFLAGQAPVDTSEALFGRKRCHVRLAFLLAAWSARASPVANARMEALGSWMSDSTTPQSLLQPTCPRAQSYTQATSTHTRAGALTFPSSRLDEGVTRVGPGQNPQYTRAPFGEEAVGCSQTTHHCTPPPHRMSPTTLYLRRQSLASPRKIFLASRVQGFSSNALRLAEKWQAHELFLQVTEPRTWPVELAVCLQQGSTAACIWTDTCTLQSHICTSSTTIAVTTTHTSPFHSRTHVHKHARTPDAQSRTQPRAQPHLQRPSHKRLVRAGTARSSDQFLQQAEHLLIYWFERGLYHPLAYCVQGNMPQPGVVLALRAFHMRLQFRWRLG